MRFEAFAGIDNVHAPEDIGDGFLTTGLNVDIADNGSLSSRDGIQRVSTGATHSLWSDGSGLMFFRRGDTLVRQNPLPDGSSLLLAVNLKGDAPMSYAAWGSRVYFCDGLNSGWTDGNSVSAWGIERPTLPVATAQGGNMPKGLYRFAVTFLREDGEESGPGPIGQIDLAPNSAVAFASLSGSVSSGVTHTAIYLTGPNSETLYRVAVVDCFTSTFVVDFSGLPTGGALATEGVEPPPKGQHCLALSGHMLVADGCFLYYSRAYQPEQFDRLRQMIPFAAPITLLIALSDALIVGTTQKILRLPGLDPDNWTLEVLAEYGAHPGNGSAIDGSLIGDQGLQGTVVGFSTPCGFCVVGTGSVFLNLTQSHYLPRGQAAAMAMFLRRRGMNQLFVTSR